MVSDSESVPSSSSLEYLLDTMCPLAEELESLRLYYMISEDLDNLVNFRPTIKDRFVELYNARKTSAFYAIFLALGKDTEHVFGAKYLQDLVIDAIRTSQEDLIEAMVRSRVIDGSTVLRGSVTFYLDFPLLSTALDFAVHAKSTSIVGSLVNSIPNRAISPVDTSPSILHELASGQDQPLKLYRLLRSSYEFPASGQGGSNALHFAAFLGQINDFEQLGSTYGHESFRIASPNGMTPLHFARNPDIVHRMPKMSSFSEWSYSTIINFRRLSDGQTPLHVAAYNGYTSVVDALLDTGAVPVLDHAGHAPIESACLGGDVHTVRYMLHVLETPVSDISPAVVNSCIELGHWEVLTELCIMGLDPSSVKPSNSRLTKICLLFDDLMKDSSERQQSEVESIPLIIRNQGESISCDRKRALLDSSFIKSALTYNSGVTPKESSESRNPEEVLIDDEFSMNSVKLYCELLRDSNWEQISIEVDLVTEVLPLAYYIDSYSLLQYATLSLRNAEDFRQDPFALIDQMIGTVHEHHIPALLNSLDRLHLIHLFEETLANSENQIPRLNALLLYSYLTANTELYPNSQLLGDHFLPYLPIHFAIKAKNLEVIQLLIDSGADLHDSHALFHALLTEDMEIIRLLLDSGVDANQGVFSQPVTVFQPAPQGNSDPRLDFSALLLASNLGVAGLPDLLLSRGASPMHIFHGVTPLHYARDAETVDLLLDASDHSPQLLNSLSVTHGSPLHSAAAAGFGDVVTRLLEAGADASVTTMLQGTPLRVAVELQHLAVVNALLHGAPITQEQKDEALWRAIDTHNKGIVVSLLQDGADPTSLEEEHRQSLLNMFHCNSSSGCDSEVSDLSDLGS